MKDKPVSIYYTQEEDGGFISGIFATDKEMFAYQKAHCPDHQCGVVGGGFPLFYIESPKFRDGDIGGWATLRPGSMESYFDSFLERKPKGAKGSDEFAVITWWDGPWTPPGPDESPDSKDYRGNDYMGTLGHHHLSWNDLRRYQAGDPVAAVIGFERSSIVEAEHWWAAQVDYPDPEKRALGRKAVRRFLVTLMIKYIESAPKQVGGLLSLMNSLHKRMKGREST